jgi:hypothetical protein
MESAALRFSRLVSFILRNLCKTFLFWNGLSLNPEKSNNLAMENYLTSGAQLDFELVLFSLIKVVSFIWLCRDSQKGMSRK